MKKGYIQSTKPMDLTSLMEFDGFGISEAEAEGVQQKVIFLVEGVWYKISVDEDGYAELQKCPTQDVTEDSALEEGGSIEDLLRIKDISELAGYETYPLIAMAVGDGADFPKIAMSANWWDRYDGKSTMNKVFGICIDHMGDPANGFKQIDVDGNALTQAYLGGAAQKTDKLATIDSNTIALVSWQSGKFVDKVGKLKWNKTGNENISVDAQFGKVFDAGSGACYTAVTPSGFSNMTIECWYFAGVSSNLTFCPAGYGGKTTAGDHTHRDFSIFIVENNARLKGHYADTKTVPLTLSSWNHIAITKSNNSEHKIYVNGKYCASVTYGQSPESNTISIAARLDSGCSMGAVNGQKLAVVRFSNCIRYTKDFDVKKDTCFIFE